MSVLGRRGQQQNVDIPLDRLMLTINCYLLNFTAWQRNSDQMFPQLPTFD